MPDWKTTTKRFTPEYKTRPKKWRMEMLDGMNVDECSECEHPLSAHFYEKDYPEFCFCMGSMSCECSACDGWRKDE